MLPPHIISIQHTKGQERGSTIGGVIPERGYLLTEDTSWIQSSVTAASEEHLPYISCHSHGFSGSDNIQPKTSNFQKITGDRKETQGYVTGYYPMDVTRYHSWMPLLETITVFALGE